MILLDTSAWIDFIKGVDTAWTRAARAAVPTGRIVIGDLIAVEVLQGIRDDRRLRRTRETLLRCPMVNLCDPVIAEEAAANYRLLRKRGIAIRGTIGVIIATWCIANRAPIVHNDRDLAVMERELGLVSYTV